MNGWGFLTDQTRNPRLGACQICFLVPWIDNPGGNIRQVDSKRASGRKRLSIARIWRQRGGTKTMRFTLGKLT